MIKNNFLALAALMLLFFILGFNFPNTGTVYEIEMTDYEKSPPTSQTIQLAVQGQNIKMDIAPGESTDKGEVIFIGERREMMVVDHKDKSYYLIDQKSIEQMSGSINNAMQEMEEKLKDLPPEQQEMIRKAMEGNNMGNSQTASKPTAPVYEYNNTGEETKVNGYPCVKYDVTKNGVLSQSLWITDWGNIEGGKESKKAFATMAGFFQELLDEVSSLGGSKDNLSGSQLFIQMEELNGFPVVSKGFGEDGGLESESALKSAKRRTLDPAEFEPPSGYKRKSMFPGQ